MSCVDSEGKVSEPEVKICSSDEVSKGKPCIDFQPDERWQIKEDAETNENVPKSKVNDVNCSNGRRSQRLQNIKSNDSIINGGADESSSDNDSINKNANDKSSTDASNNSNSGKTRPKRKQSDLGSEISHVQESDNAVKKAKLSDVESTGDNENCNGAANCDITNERNSEDKMAGPNPPPSPCKTHEELKDDSFGVDSSVEVNEDENKESASSENSCASEKSLKNPDKKDNDKEFQEITINDDESKNKETSNDVDIEIISVTHKKPVENDPDIQIINVDENSVKSSVADFPSCNSSNNDVSLTAGFPYYNSLKEKMSGFKAGEYKPVKFPHTGTLLLAENEVIIESPSLLVPLLIKESDEFPKLDGEEKKENGDNCSIAKSNMISKKNFFQSSVGQFLINLGMSRVEEWYHRDMKRSRLKQLKSNKPTEEDLEKTVEFHEKRHNELKEINAAFNFRIRQCRHCSYKTESQLVMDGHLLTPHLSQRREFKCNFCEHTTRDSEQIKFHYEALHGKKAIMEADIPFYECIFCSFQTNLKTKINGHMNRCRKHFIPSQNLAPPFDFEFPGVTTKPVTIADVIGHRRLLLNSASAKNRQPMLEDANSAYARKKLASVLNKLSVPSTYDDQKSPNLMKQLMKSQTQLPPMSAASNIQLPPGIVITRPRGSPIQQMQPVGRYPHPRGIQTIRGQVPRPRGPPYVNNISTAASHLASSGISITPVSRSSILPRVGPIGGIRNVTLTPISSASNRTVSPKPGPPQPVALYTNVAGSTTGLLGQPQARLPLTMNIRQLRPAVPYQRLSTPPSQVIKGSSGNTFVVCEICDAYIKDLEELRTHMNWVHKVKIHPKMLVSRPPLNCQKCQWRFFTDQGLERHLLGAHGLVTTNMQEMANKNQDGGRCIICGAVFTYKLVSHMTQVHKVTLKPAHLSYKCTVCTATFTLYRLFESHVYNVHSGSAKRPADESSSEPPTKKTADNSVPKRCKECNIVTENMHDHLIKKHIKKCSVKLCRIEKCKKCLYSSDEMILIRMSDFGLDEDDSGDDSDSSDGSSDGNEDTKT